MDVVSAVIGAAESEIGDERIFNVGGGTPTSIRQVLGLIGSLADKRLDVSYLDQERGDVQDTAADTTLARERLGFAPQTSLDAGLGAEFSWLEGLIAHEQSDVANRA